MLVGMVDPLTIIADLVESVFEVDSEKLEKFQEELEYNSGSQGTQRIQTATLFDFLPTEGKKKLQSKDTEKVEEKKEVKSISNGTENQVLVEPLSRSIPFGWSFVSLETSGLLTGIAFERSKRCSKLVF